jgi:hypothetical protein
MPLLRWLLVVPLGLAGAFFGFASAAFLASAAVKLCPEELLVSGMCTASWYPALEQSIMCFGGALGAVGAVALPALAAPAHKKYVALVALILGAAYSLWVLVGVGSFVLLPAVAAIAAGLLATLATFRRSARAALYLPPDRS